MGCQLLRCGRDVVSLRNVTEARLLWVVSVVLVPVVVQLAVARRQRARLLPCRVARVRRREGRRPCVRLQP